MPRRRRWTEYSRRPGGVPLFGEAASYGFLPIASALAWGLGYFGVPQVLLRFMAIRHEDELKRSRRIATVWVLISLSIAVFIGLVGRTLYPTALTTSSDAENVFILLSTNLLPPLIAGFVMAGILAATISSSDSYLLIAASAFAKNIYQGLFRKKASDREVLNISRITLLLIAVVAIIIALDENSVIFTIVSFAWAGFGATFGPLMLFSLFWKRTTRAGAHCRYAGRRRNGLCMEPAGPSPGRPVGYLRAAAGVSLLLPVHYRGVTADARSPLSRFRENLKK